MLNCDDQIDVEENDRNSTWDWSNNIEIYPTCRSVLYSCYQAHYAFTICNNVMSPAQNNKTAISISVWRDA